MEKGGGQECPFPFQCTEIGSHQGPGEVSAARASPLGGEKQLAAGSILCSRTCREAPEGSQRAWCVSGWNYYYSGIRGPGEPQGCYVADDCSPLEKEK